MYQLDDFQNGQVLLVNKPLEWTSFQVVNKIHWLLRKRFDIKKIKVGHAGTLDPLATGLLLVCTGKKTKQIQDLMGNDKTYTGTICLGATTPSYDLETEVICKSDTSSLSEQELKNATKLFLGHIQQKPPIFSAIKQKGNFENLDEALILMDKAVKNAIKDSGNISIKDHIDEIRVPKGFWRYSCL